jgi:hypothetical protein
MTIGLYSLLGKEVWILPLARTIGKVTGFVINKNEPKVKVRYFINSEPHEGLFLEEEIEYITEENDG